MSYVTVFRNAEGPLTKRAGLDAQGQLELEPGAGLVRGDFRTLPVAHIDELAELIASLTPREALAFGVARNGAAEGPVLTVKALGAKVGGSRGGAVARTTGHFVWPSGAGWMMLDIDLRGLPASLESDLQSRSLAGLRDVLLMAMPELAEFPMLGMPSASAYLYRTVDGHLLRGLSGARFYLPVAKAADIPACGRLIHERLVLAGYGFGFVSRAGTVHIRSIVDTSVWSPERLDFAAGAACADGVRQDRGAPCRWNGIDGAKLELRQLKPLDNEERKQLHAIEEALRSGAQANAATRRAQYIEERRATGHPIAVTWTEAGAVQSLKGEHTVLLTDGAWVTVDDILSDPERFHGATCADPLEPEVGGQDRRLARIYTLGQRHGPAIHSFAHGGGVFMLNASAAADFPGAEDAAAASSPQTSYSTAGERMAALLGEASRPFLMELPRLEDDEILRRWEALTTAARSGGDPLAQVFSTEVVPTALRPPAGDFAQFRAVLDALLSEDRTGERRGWAALGLPDRHLLIRTAYALFAKLGKLTERLSESPGQPLSLEHVERRYLVEGLIPMKGLAALVGLPGQGKSFLALELAGRVAKEPVAGEPERFAGRAVEHGSVLYFTSEDADGLRGRAAAWEKANGGIRSNFHLFPRVPALSSLDRTIPFVLEAIDAVRRPGAPSVKLVVIDVLRAAIEGEENSSDVMGPAMAAAIVISRMTGATVLLVHHAALGDPERGRGSSAFTGAQDFIGAVTQEDRGILLKVKKNKNGPAGQVLTWHLHGGILRPGPAAGEATGYSNETGALTAGRVIREIAGAEVGVTRRQLAAALAEARPDLFGEGVNTKTADTRVSRSLKAAVEEGWVVKRRGEKYGPGPVAPPGDPLDFEVDDLAQSA